MATIPRRSLFFLLLGGAFVLGVWVINLHRFRADFLPSLLQLQPNPLASQPLPRPVLRDTNLGKASPNLENQHNHHNNSSPSSLNDSSGDVLLPRQRHNSMSLGYSGNTLRNEEAPLKNGSRFLIFECVNTGGLCGGWGDRQEGLVTVFLLAYLTRRRFGIRMDSPCDVTKFVVPNHYDWIVADKELRGKSTRHVWAIDFTDFSRQMSTMDFNTRYPEDVVFLQTNRDLWKDVASNPLYRHLLPSWANGTRPEFFRDVWHSLMKPSPSLEARLKGLLEESVHYFSNGSSHRRPLVGVHVRTGGSKSFSDGKFGDRLSHLDVLWTFLSPYVRNGSDVFIASDNPIVRQESQARFGPRHHDTQVVLRHIDRQRSDPEICQAFEGAVLDQLILTHCDVLVVSPGSGYSSRAAMIRGTNRQLFNFDHAISPADMNRMCDPIC